MLLEAFVAVIALSTVLILAPGDVGGRSAGRVYGDGMASFLTVLIGRDGGDFAVTFGAMVFSTFVFDTIDVATRLGRHVLQELVGRRTRTSAAIATALTVGVPLACLLAAPANSYLKFWHLFGTANQLLAGLTLLALAVWLKRRGKANGFVALPMGFVLVVTLWSLLAQARSYLSAGASATDLANGIVAVLLGVLAALLIVDAVRALRRAAASASGNS
jgi:carbon starvation protein